MKLLITGFDPFGGAVINPAYEAVKLLPDHIAGFDIIKLEVPTVFVDDGLVLSKAIEENHPLCKASCQSNGQSHEGQGNSGKTVIFSRYLCMQ